MTRGGKAKKRDHQGVCQYQNRAIARHLFYLLSASCLGFRDVMMMMMIGFQR